MGKVSHGSFVRFPIDSLPENGATLRERKKFRRQQHEIDLVRLVATLERALAPVLLKVRVIADVPKVCAIDDPEAGRLNAYEVRPTGLTLRALG